MCGIAGLVSLAAPTPPPNGESILRAMLARIAHRGPDGEGIERAGRALLGHRRLSIIDLTGGAQPISSGPITLVFNGEIYNYVELSEQLIARGHVFRTRSDSEVLAAALAEWGRDALPRLRGMFAFAAWDGKRLILARDRLGKKPLYFARRGDVVAFSSELPSLLAWPAIARELDPAALGAYLRYGYIAAPSSAIAGVRKLGAGCVVDSDALDTQARYWDVDYGDKFRDPRVAERELAQLLDSAVRDRLIADVPVGAFLSGGLDSALVTSLAARATTGPLRTFTVGFAEDANLDEREPARVLAQALGADHTERALSINVSLIINDVVKHLGEPLADPSSLPTYLVAELASGQVKVVVTGDGGDENFAGYHRYARTRLSLAYPRLPKPLRKVAAAALMRLGVPRARIDEVEARAARPPGHSYAQAMSVFDEQSARALLSQDHRAAGSVSDDALVELHDGASATDWLDRLLYTDLRSYLAESVLTKVDRMTMAHGIEARSPLLDHRLVEFAARLPSSWKRPPGAAGKQPLRQLAPKILPPGLTERPKRGFDIPLQSWMSAGPLRATIEETMRESQLVADGWLDATALAREIAPGQNGVAPLGNRIWSAYILELWYRIVIKEKKEGPQQ